MRRAISTAAAALIAGLCAHSPATAEPPPFPEFTFKRVKPPKSGGGKRITIQISPEDQQRAKPAAVPKPDAKAAANFVLNDLLREQNAAGHRAEEIPLPATHLAEAAASRLRDTGRTGAIVIVTGVDHSGGGAAGAAPPWEVLVAVAGTVAAAAALVWIGSRVYAGALLRTGGKVKLIEAWKAAVE